MENNTKKELKVVLSPELHDELRFTFRPELLENIIYLPESLGNNKWQCCCGSTSELDVCPICGMDKNTVFSKVNAAYLSRHRKARIARKKKAVQDQQAMMAAQLLKKNKKQKQPDENTKKFGILVGVIILCAAIIASIAIIFSGNGDPKKPIDTTINNVQQTTSPDFTEPEESVTLSPETEESTVSPETQLETEPETTIPETTAPVIAVEVTITNSTDVISTVANGKWPSGASGNVSVGGLVYTSGEYDYIASNGITVLDKSGNTVSTLTSNKALGITGSGTYIFYIDEQYSVHRIDITTKEDITFPYKARMICAYYDELYYVPNEGPGFFASNFYGDKTKIVTTTLNIYALNNTADKLYFSTDESLAVITSQDGNVTTFCPDGAKTQSIIEITECIFYTDAKGVLKFYNPKLGPNPGFEYPRYGMNITYVSAYDNRVYVRAVNPTTGAVTWLSTSWVSGTWLFNPASFTATGVTTEALYITGSAIYDGNLNRFAVN